MIYILLGQNDNHTSNNKTLSQLFKRWAILVGSYGVGDGAVRVPMIPLNQVNAW